jgi:O-methyltransferase involved in polyketide biosynthesis
MRLANKITLSPEQETLLIPLYAKARPDNPFFTDAYAGDILGKIVEGLLMSLTEHAVRQLILRLHRHFPAAAWLAMYSAA